MTLDYIYHSGFAIEMEGVTVIIDYYKDSSETEHNRGIVHDYLLQRPGKLYVFVFRGRATQKRGRYTDFVPIACLYGFHNWYRRQIFHHGALLIIRYAWTVSLQGIRFL